MGQDGITVSGGFLVDTDVFVDFLRGSAQGVAFVQENAQHILMSSIVVAELYAGAREDELVELDDLPRLFPVLPVTAEIARAAGLLKAEYGRSHGLGLADALVAATARQHGLALKTLNSKHFPMFPGLAPAYPK